MDELTNEVLQRVIGQYAEENANMRIVIERLSLENQSLKEEQDKKKKQESGDK